MKKLTVRLSDQLAAHIKSEARRRKVSQSDIIRERLSRARSRQQWTVSLDSISDLIGSVDGLPKDLSARKKKYLVATGFRRKRSGYRRTKRVLA
jgi:hypothetical protein